MKLTGYEKSAFKAWAECDEDYSILSFKAIAHRAEMDISKVRRAVRGLARKGLVEFSRVSWSDEGVVGGAGYGLTKDGVDARGGQS